MRRIGESPFSNCMCTCAGLTVYLDSIQCDSRNRNYPLQHLCRGPLVRPVGLMLIFWLPTQMHPRRPRKESYWSLRRLVGTETRGVQSCAHLATVHQYANNILPLPRCKLQIYVHLVVFIKIRITFKQLFGE